MGRGDCVRDSIAVGHAAPGGPGLLSSCRWNWIVPAVQYSVTSKGLSASWSLRRRESATRPLRAHARPNSHSHLIGIFFLIRNHTTDGNDQHLILILHTKGGRLLESTYVGNQTQEAEPRGALLSGSKSGVSGCRQRSKLLRPVSVD